MRPRLLILSDLWGKAKSSWVDDYINLLQDTFEIQFYDCCELGGVDTTIFIEENIHSQFVNGGIERAVDVLLDKEKKQVFMLAFSIGGTIAWKAALNGLNIETLYLISSTRLRYEIQAPSCNLKLYYGDQDNYIPDISWFINFQIIPELNKNKSHLMYVEKDFIHLICDVILKENT